MKYVVYCETSDDKRYIKAICNEEKIANEYVKYLEKEKRIAQDNFYRTDRAFTYYCVENILEDSDILELTKK